MRTTRPPLTTTAKSSFMKGTTYRSSNTLSLSNYTTILRDVQKELDENIGYIIMIIVIGITIAIGQNMGVWQAYLETLDQKLHEQNKVNEYLAVIERKTGVKRLYIAVGLFALWALYMILGRCAELICNSIGFGYPAYASMIALETHHKEDDTKWLTYWVVFALFSLLEFFSEIILDFVPFYWLAKCIFLIWCFLPIANNGSQFLYNKFIKPVFLKNRERIEDTIKTTASGITSILADGKTALLLGPSSLTAEAAAKLASKSE